MPELSKDLIALLQYLLPGFLVAWIFYGVTSHQKPSQFERVVQALIYAIFVHFIVNLECLLAVAIGTWRNLGAWSREGELFASFITAITIGILFSYLLNSDLLHRALRKINLSTRSGHPSEWCTVFEREKTYVVLHFKDERRLYGWPHIWPSDPTKGHLFIVSGSWLPSVAESILIEEKQVEDDQDEIRILVDVMDVKWIEFIPDPEKSNGNKTAVTAAATV